MKNNFDRYIEILKNNNIAEKDYFYVVSKCYLISKIRTENKNGDDILKKVYPYIFLNDQTNYDAPDLLKIINYLSTEKDEDFIGKLYEKTINKSQKKDVGMFYTRKSKLINYMISIIDENIDGSFVEPSCGSGTFILSIIDKIMNKNQDKETLIKMFNNINAVDCDETACKITEINILVETINLIKKVYKEDNNIVLPKLNIKCLDFINYKAEKKFDFIIGNPPYVTFYGKRSRNMNEEKRKIFNSFDFVQNKNGNNKFNMLMFFIENGLKSLKDNGKLIFIIDFAFFETAFIDLRKYLLSNYSIESITDNISEFDNVASGQVILSIIKKVPDKDTITKWIDYKSNEQIEIKQSLWNNKNLNYKIYKPFYGLKKEINEKCNRFDNLSNFYPNKCLRTCCALTGRTDDFIVDNNKKTNNYIFPYIEGSKGLKTKFGNLTPTKYIEFDYQKQLNISNEFKAELQLKGVKNKKRVTLGDKDVYLSPKIFIRQSSTTLIATYSEQPLAANNSIYVLSNKLKNEDEKKKLKYFCGLLNSNLLSFYALTNNIIRTGLGKQPQIKTSDLKKLKIAYDKNNANKIIEITEKLLKKYNEGDFKKLNEEVYKIYNINNEEISFIESYLKKSEI